MKSLIDNSSFLYLFTLGMAFVISWGLTPLCRLLAIKLNIIDRPHSEVKTHHVPTPYLGGLAIWVGWVISLFVIRYFTHFPTGTLRSLRGILTGSLIMLVLGLADDIVPRGLGFKNKFLVQILASVIILFFDIQIHFVSPSFVAIAFTIIWVVGITNAFNIIDIMDGLSAGIAVIASFAFLFIALPSEMIYVNFCSAALAGACLGFLPFNFSKNKKIFMGDTGSLTIGFILAAVSVGTSYTKENYIGLFAPLLILAIPIYDTFLVMVLRWKKGQSPFLGSRDHFALRLEKMGFSRKKILVMTYATGIVLAVGAYSVTRLDLVSALIVFAINGCGALLLGYWLSKVKID
jgi:UDP-GlcNAc:undecaprenyl-phosphate GlcNAc-1-phosphate transferase